MYRMKGKKWHKGCRVLAAGFTVMIVSLLLNLPCVAQESEHDGHSHEETIWTCSMHPQIQLPEFGQCPICFMDLIEVPKQEDGGERVSLRQISFDDNARKLAQVEVSPVIRGDAVVATRMFGRVDYDESLVATINAWVGGRIDTLHVDYTGAHVKKKQAMAEIYSPDLLYSQAELIQAVAARKKLKTATLSLVRDAILKTETAAREKLRLLGLTDKQIEDMVSRGVAAEHVTITAPLSGIVIKKDVLQGMYLKTGAPLFTIADLSSLWVNLDAYETDLNRVVLGQQVEFTVEALPGEGFIGKVAYIDPVVDEKSRTVQVRLNVKNPDGKLKPGMFVRAQLKKSASAEKASLLIPVSAPLHTGKRALVYVQLPKKEGVYEGREVVLGIRSGAYYQVRSGLEEGELVVTKGNFKIDSAIQIQGRPSMMTLPSVAVSTVDEVDPLFLSKLQFLNKAFVEFSEASLANDRKTIDKTLAVFKTKLEGIDPFFLTPKNQLMWKDLSMLLRSDVILAAEATSKRELAFIYADMASHLQQVLTYFHIDKTPKQPLGAPDLQKSLGLFLKSYIKLQLALADDKLDASKSSLPGVVEKGLEAVTVLQKQQDSAAQKTASQLAQNLKKIEKTVELEAIREAFYPLSKTMITTIETYGASGVGPVYVHFCPMAFNDTGATWLADNEIITNPYFGHAMLRCGEVRRQLQE